DAAPLLDSNTNRAIYTVSQFNTRLDFSMTETNSTALQETLLAPDLTTAGDIIDWMRSPRFGLSQLHVLGAVENSTGALLTPPNKPYWWPLATTPASERQLFQTFMDANVARPRLLFIGSKDGAMHAYHTNPSAPNDPTNGTEAWAFVPYDVS